MKDQPQHPRRTFADIQRAVLADSANDTAIPCGEPITEERPSPVEGASWGDESGANWRSRGSIQAKRLRRLMADPTVRVVVWRRPWGTLEEVPPEARDALFIEVEASMVLDESPWCGYRPYELKDASHRSLVVIEA